MAIVQVQAPAAASAGAVSATTIANTFGVNVTAGSLLVAGATCGSGGGATHTYSSTGAPAWTKVAQFTEAVGGEIISLGYCMNAPAGATTVTVTFSVSSDFRALVIGEYSGAATTAALDQNTTGQTTAATITPTDTAMVTTANGELIWSILQFRNATRPASAGAGFTGVAFDNTNANFGAEYQIQTSAGSIAPSFTLTAGTVASGIMSATFKQPAVAVALPILVTAPPR